MHLFLFDIDGVLVEAHGYLRALQDTLAYFSRQMGVGAHPPTEAEVRALEANGLTSEWDSAPACLGALLIERLKQSPTLDLPPSWPEALEVLSAHPLPLPHPDYTTLAERIARHQQQHREIAHAARAVLQEDASILPRHQYQTVLTLLDILLGNTHTFESAPITQHFQHRVIGHEVVALTYGITPDFDSPAYLQIYDTSALSETSHTELQAHFAANSVRAAIYTARPSLPPTDVSVNRQSYSPEAELAQALVKLKHIPLIGLGKLQWLANQSGERAAQLVKPSPVQALAAIGAAWSGQEASALQAALTFHRDRALQPPLEGINHTTIHVFEDSPGSMRAVRTAVNALLNAGLNVQWQPYGITPAQGPKFHAMTEMGIPTYRSINDALQIAFQTVSLH